MLPEAREDGCASLAPSAGRPGGRARTRSPAGRGRGRPEPKRGIPDEMALRRARADGPIIGSAVTPHVEFQPSLLDASPTCIDPSFSAVGRIHLDETAWVDHAPGWVRGSDRLFALVLASREWGERTRWMYDRRVREPRLTSAWSLASGAPLEPPILEEIRRRLSERYGVPLDSVGFNLYRDGRDSVAWHADRIEREIEDPVVALVSLGEPRRFLLRPRGGGRSIAFRLGRGDLLVTGGSAQRAWEHCVPKAARAGPRISVAYRHGLDPRAYGRDP